MFQRALNTTIYSLSQNLSHLLLRYDELGNTARYSLISLSNGYKEKKGSFTFIHCCFNLQESKLLLPLVSGQRLDSASWASDSVLVIVHSGGRRLDLVSDLGHLVIISVISVILSYHPLVWVSASAYCLSFVFRWTSGPMLPRQY